MHGNGSLIAGSMRDRAHDGRRDKAVHQLTVAETYFAFLRMNIDVNARRVDRKREHEHRLGLYVQHIGISRLDGMLKDAITYEATVYEEKLLVGPAAGGRRQPYPAFEMQAGRIGLKGAASVLEFRRHHGKNALGRGLSRQMKACPSIRKHAKAY